MNYKGSYTGDTEYDIGDVVVFEGVAWCKTKVAPAGTLPHDVRYWGRVLQPLQEVVMMFHGALSNVPKNISDDAIVLKTDDGEYLITVDDSGETPELAVDPIEEEGD